MLKWNRNVHSLAYINCFLCDSYFFNICLSRFDLLFFRHFLAFFFLNVRLRVFLFQLSILKVKKQYLNIFLRGFRRSEANRCPNCNYCTHFSDIFLRNNEKKSQMESNSFHTHCTAWFAQWYMVNTRKRSVRLHGLQFVEQCSLMKILDLIQWKTNLNISVRHIYFALLTRKKSYIPWKGFLIKIATFPSTFRINKFHAILY